MSTFGWIAVIIVFVIMILITVQMFIQTPKNNVLKRILAVAPMIVAGLFVMLIPQDILYINETASSLFRMLIPFVGMAFSFPLILKAKKEIEIEK